MSTSRCSLIQRSLPALPHQRKRIKQSADGLQGLQRHPQNCPPRNGTLPPPRKRRLSARLPPQTLGSLRRHAEETKQYVRLSCTSITRQNRPYHLKNDKIEDLDRTSTNLIAGTLFGEGSVQEYEALYFKEIDRVGKD